MIALIAAVTEETCLIRESMQDSVQQFTDGVTTITATISSVDLCLAHCGVGKAAAAATVATVISSYRPKVLFMFGCAGAYPDSGLMIGDLALASGELFGDEGVMTPHGFMDLAAMNIPMRQQPEQTFNSWPVDVGLYDWARPLLTGHAKQEEQTFLSGPFVTVSTCTGTTAKALELRERTGGICENMEGAAAALACRQFSIPMLELRGISNMVEDRDTARWDLKAGMETAQRAVLHLIEAFADQQP